MILLPELLTPETAIACLVVFIIAAFVGWRVGYAHGAAAKQAQFNEEVRRMSALLPKSSDCTVRIL